MIFPADARAAREKPRHHYRRSKQIGASASALALAIMTSPAGAQTSAESRPREATIEDVIVTGTRDYGVKARESTAPVTVVSGERLKATGRTNIVDALQRLDPSYSIYGVGGDLNNLVRSPRLRGLTASHVLVLVNGKRRHGTANLSSSGFTKGAAGADLDLIPVALVDHIEILEDGAAAQYGSDAIAGVINIILKADSDGGGVSALVGSYGQSYNPNTHGNGLTRNLQADKSFAIGNQGFLTLGADLTSHLHSNQTGPDRTSDGTGLRVGPGTAYPWVDPNVAAIIGDAAYINGSAGLNAGYEFDNGVQFYLFGTGAGRRGEAFQNYRAPNLNGTAASKIIDPSGFVPAETIHEEDWSLTGGAKGKVFDDVRWDLSLTYGSDKIDVGLNQSANVSLFNDTLAAFGAGWTPRQFYIGQYLRTLRTINLDLGKEVAPSFLPAPVNISIGAENRHETYGVRRGDFFSYYSSGPAAWVGIRPTDESDHSRESFAGYVDLSSKPLPDWKIDIAGRYETFSDFGDTINGKLSTRYDISPAIALRGTVSTGFRAPTLAEEFFSQTTVSPTTATVVLPPNSSAARIAGGQPLKPEKSTNISLGVVTEPLKDLHVSVDAYQIDLRDRVVTTGSLTGPTALAAITASGNSLQPGAVGTVSFFVNGAFTRTRGVDVKADYAYDLGSYGALRFDAAASFIETTILSVIGAPAAFNGAPLLNAAARSNITDVTPRTKVVFGGSYLYDSWTFSLHFTQYGNISQTVASPFTGSAPFFTNVITPKFITDGEIAYDFGSGLRAAIGGNNLFGVRPDQTVPFSRNQGAAIFPVFSPFGVNGGYYYARVSLRF
ncbi:TonB-dependent receptor [Methylosinus sp. H3A]|uniref:TonB-dependent receptor plug domain-containing protein n=1 Tax=Methylosinus sp. H3A TaxID=2785786 RepID=UPI0018C2418E|nr:TonB-dependent receptor [Methylosinus sp. H3A]MBG0809961.1 TonB-dependent receptor [Methylosinus sp. H3A]